jgi:hypothetical protein
MNIFAMKKTRANRIARIPLCLLALAALLAMRPSEAQGWGARGHELSGRAAAMKLPAAWNYLRSSNALVEQLYLLDKQEPFGDKTASPEHRKFVSARLAAGALMLRDLWWTAWVTSAPAPTGAASEKK